MNTLPSLPSSVTTVPSTTFIQVMLGSGMANTVQVTVAEKVTFSVSFDGVTVTFGGSAENNQTFQNLRTLQMLTCDKNR